MRRLAILLFILVSLAPLCANAHPGKTDENGGHYDYSTGEYHYHHGYPAHFHYDIDGDGKDDCPHDFVDRTGWNSGSSSGSGYYSSNQFSDSYLDGYNEGHEAGYYDGYSDGESKGKSEGYSNGYDAGVSKTEAKMKAENEKAIEAEHGKAFYACVGVCAGTATIASISGRKRKKEDAATIESARAELLSSNRKMVSVNHDLDSATKEIADIKYKYEQSLAKTEQQSKELIATKLEVDRLQTVVEANAMETLRQQLINIYGERYIYALAAAPSGDYLDEKGLPHSTVISGFKSADKYVFYLGGSFDRPTKRYHTKFCQHANMGLPVNAYHLSKWGSYTRCMQCMPKVPDVSWVERYNVYKSILKDIDIGEESILGQDTDGQASQAAPPSPHN